MFGEDNSSARMQNDSVASVEGRLILILFILVAQLAVLFTLHPQVAGAASRTLTIPRTPQSGYPCSVPFVSCCTYSHCYGVNDWRGSIGGSFTAITVVKLQPGDGAITDEMWIDDNNLMCPIEPGGSSIPCEVEAGYVIKNDGHGEHWFWVDVRPNGGYYHEHDSNPLQSGDYGL